MKRHFHLGLSAATLSAVAASLVACGAGDQPSSSSSTKQPDTAAKLALTADASHPAKLYLTDAVLARLASRAAAGDAAWTTLKARCDGLATAPSFELPSGSAYPSFPDVGQGYEGDGYLPEVMNLGLCYRVTFPTDPATAATYGAAGGMLLDAMSTPVAGGGEDPSTNSGYGIRNYGVGMATGFDWLYPALSATTRASVITALNAWVDWYDASGFSNAEPIGNYFTGYLLAKTTTAIATGPDNVNAAGYWSDVQTRLWGQIAQPAYAASMTGGGWPEGWEYGELSVEEMAQFFLAVQTGMGLDWSNGFTRGEAEYLGYFAWPSLLHMDDMGLIHAQPVLAPPAVTEAMLATMLAYAGDAYAPTALAMAAAMKATNTAAPDVPSPWQDFLFWDPSLPQAAYTSQPLSYFAPGPSHVAVRSAWSKTAVWGTFVAGQYIDAPESGEQFFNEGGIAVVSGDTPLVANATGWLPQVDDTTGEDLVYADEWTNETRLLANTYNIAGSVQDEMVPGQATTHVMGYEDNGSVVHARGTGIGQMYGGSAVTQFTRDFAYVRPGTFVVYDRTTATNGSADQWLSWHTAAQPSSVPTADTTQRRYDVSGVGSIRTLLPQSAAMSVVTVEAPVYRIEAHPPSATAAIDWLTVITAGATTPEEVTLSAAAGNVSAGNVVGVLVESTPNAVVLFNADHAAAAQTTSAKYKVAQTADASHVLFDVAPSSTGYSVTVTVAGGAFAIDVEPGGPFQPSSLGTLSFTITAAGIVDGATPTPPPPPPPPPPAPAPAPTPPPAPAPAPTPTPTPTPPPAPPPAPAPTPTPSPAPTPTPTPTPSPTPAPSPTGTAQNTWKGPSDTGTFTQPGQTITSGR